MPRTNPQSATKPYPGEGACFEKDDLPTPEAWKWVETEPYSKTAWDSMSDLPEDCKEYLNPSPITS